MFNGHKPHHPSIRFFLYFAERRGPGCCCAWADKKGRSFLRFSRNGPRNAQGHLVVKRVDNVDVINAVRSDPDLARLCNGFAFSSNAPAIKPVMHILSGAEQDKRRKAKALAKAVREAQRKTGLD